MKRCELLQSTDTIYVLNTHTQPQTHAMSSFKCCTNKLNVPWPPRIYSYTWRRSNITRVRSRCHYYNTCAAQSTTHNARNVLVNLHYLLFAAVAIAAAAAATNRVQMTLILIKLFNLEPFNSSISHIQSTHTHTPQLNKYMANDVVMTYPQHRISELCSSHCEYTQNLQLYFVCVFSSVPWCRSLSLFGISIVHSMTVEGLPLPISFRILSNPHVLGCWRNVADFFVFVSCKWIQFTFDVLWVWRIHLTFASVDLHLPRAPRGRERDYGIETARQREWDDVFSQFFPILNINDDNVRNVVIECKHKVENDKKPLN